VVAGHEERYYVRAALMLEYSAPWEPKPAARRAS
jgi:hypothetical protein